MSDELKAKINWSFKFNKRSYQIIEGYLRIVEHTNLAHIEPHKVIIGDKLFKKTFAKSVSNEEYNKTLKEDLNNFAKNTSDELSDLKGKDTNILVEINNIQPKNKGLYKIISIIKK